jgi:hypothetical protein
VADIAAAIKVVAEQKPSRACRIICLASQPPDGLQESFTFVSRRAGQVFCSPRSLGVFGATLDRRFLKWPPLFSIAMMVLLLRGFLVESLKTYYSSTSCQVLSGLYSTISLANLAVLGPRSL